MYKYTFLLFTTFITSALLAQSYNSALGVRLSTNFGFTYQQRISKRMTVEGLIQSNLFTSSYSSKLLFEQHLPLITRRFNVYVGAGPDYRLNKLSDANTFKGTIGIAGVLGAEYSVKNLNISVDLMPGFHLNDGINPFYLQKGISVRYILWKRPSKTKQWFEDKKWKFWKRKDSK